MISIASVLGQHVIAEGISDFVNLNGGATFDCLTLQFRESSDLGYAVSLPGAELVVADCGPEQIADYIEANSPFLNVAGRYLGVWEDEGLTYLDISVIFNDKATALNAGIHWGQKAIFDFSAGESIYI